MLTYQLYNNLQMSLKDFLDAQISSDSVTDINGDAVPVYIGRKNDDTWTLPCFAVYVESENNTRSGYPV